MAQMSILLIEDEALIRMMLVEMVEELGHRVVAEAGSVMVGRSLAEIAEYDLAILDINLQGFSVEPIAEAIRDRGLPFFFLSGYGSAGVPDGFRRERMLHKPCTPEELRSMIDLVLANASPHGAPDESSEASRKSWPLWSKPVRLGSGTSFPLHPQHPTFCTNIVERRFGHNNGLMRGSKGHAR